MRTEIFPGTPVSSTSILQKEGISATTVFIFLILKALEAVSDRGRTKLRWFSLFNNVQKRSCGQRV